MSSRSRFSTRSKTSLRRARKSMENYNKATMDVQERSNPLFEKLTDLPSLTIEKKSSESLNEIEIENTWQKDDLLFIANAMEKLNKAFGRIDRYGNDVPCVRPLREICAKLKVQLNGEYGMLSRVLQHLRRERLPGHKKILESIETLREAVDSVVAEEEDYVAKLEDIRQSVGELAGIANTLLKLQF